MPIDWKTVDARVQSQRLLIMSQLQHKIQESLIIPPFTRITIQETPFEFRQRS
jgi:hypothetical protein